MGKTSIEWTDFSVNPIRARLNGRVGHHCVKVSAGCANCYASRLQPRFGLPPFELGKRQGVKPFFDETKVHEVLDRQAPTRWFWCDMSDLFGEWVPDAWIDRCFAVMALTPHHTHQVLTKRPQRMRDYVMGAKDRVWDAATVLLNQREAGRRDLGAGASVTFSYFRRPEHRDWPLPKVWLGASAEDQERWDERVEQLGQVPAVVRFVSAEPLLGDIDCGNAFDAPPEGSPYQPVNWVIIGGESGPGARPCVVDWVRSLRDQCRAADVPAFIKQLGANIEDRNDVGFEGDTPSSWPMDRETGGPDMGYQGAPIQVRLRDRKGGDPNEWPQDLRVREYPA